MLTTRQRITKSDLVVHSVREVTEIDDTTYLFREDYSPPSTEALVCEKKKMDLDAGRHLLRGI